MEDFGRLLCVIGNQYSYIISSEKLDSKPIRIWEGQRSLDGSRLKELIDFQKEKHKTNGYFSFRGSLLICKDNASGDIWLIDGQHRFVAMKALIDTEEYPVFDIRVDILNTSSTLEIRQEFQDVNKSVPVPLNFLEPDEIINITVRLLEKKFPKAFTNSKTTRPRINVNDFKSCLIKENITSNFKLNEHQLYDAICKFNDDIAKTAETTIITKLARNNKTEQQTVRNCRAKCETGDFLYIGLYKGNDWIIDLVANLSEPPNPPAQSQPMINSQLPVQTIPYANPPVQNPPYATPQIPYTNYPVQYPPAQYLPFQYSPVQYQNPPVYYPPNQYQNTYPFQVRK